MEAHITSICKAANFHIRNIGSIRQYLSEEAGAQVIHAFVTSCLDYGYTILGGLSDKSLLRFRWVQNNAARLVTLTH